MKEEFGYAYDASLKDFSYQHGFLFSLLLLLWFFRLEVYTIYFCLYTVTLQNALDQM